VPNWRDELQEAVKGKAERDAEEKERQRKRVEEALTTADAALQLAKEALTFSYEKLKEKGQDVSLDGSDDGLRLVFKALSLGIALDRETAIIKITFAEQKPREFDFARDRHIAAADVEEYVGRRSVELVRAAQKAEPW
jgi:hypothetical protein